MLLDWMLPDWMLPDWMLSWFNASWLNASCHFQKLWILQYSLWISRSSSKVSLDWAWTAWMPDKCCAYITTSCHCVCCSAATLGSFTTVLESFTTYLVKEDPQDLHLPRDLHRVVYVVCLFTFSTLLKGSYRGGSGGAHDPPSLISAASFLWPASNSSIYRGGLAL